MRIRSLVAASALAALALASRAVAETETKTTAPEPKTCVMLAKSWDAAIKEGKALNLPLVVHNHGFYCGPCWGMHASVMCDAEYVAFAFENTVEVISLDRLQEGVTKNEEHAATYPAKEGSKKIDYLVEFPGMTVDDMLALRASKASSYNKTGKLPYTCLVDPFTETELKSWQGSTPLKDILDGVAEARKTLAKAHGKSKPRKEIATLTDTDAASKAKVAAGDFSGAIAAYAAIPKTDKWPSFLRDRISKSKEEIVAAATAALDKIDAAKADDPAKAKKDLAVLSSHLKGTGLESRAKDLLATLP